MPIEVTVTKEALKLTASGRRRWSALAAKKNVEQMKAKLDGNGNPLPKGVDLYQTGDLQKKVTANEEGYTFTVDYAEDVDDRFHFQGLSPSSLADLEPALEDVGATEFYTEETEG
jgi:hypothetical protein